MEKRNLYPIGKAAEICKVSPRALRYYEEKGLIKPDEISSSRYRYYSADTLLLVQLIRYYIDEGFSLQEAEQLLRRDSFDVLEQSFQGQMDFGDAFMLQIIQLRLSLRQAISARPFHPKQKRSPKEFYLSGIVFRL